MPESAQSQSRPARRVLLVGLDAAEWAVLRPLMEAGRLPNFTKLIESGLSGTMTPLLPSNSAPAWTSIATGKRATDHGVYTAVVPDARGIRPVTPTDRAAHPVWTIASTHGLTAHCIAWPAIHVSEPISGVCVSESFVSGIDDDLIASPATAEPIRSLRLLPHQLQAGTLRELVGEKAMALAAHGDARLRACAGLLAQAVTTHHIAAALAAGEWDLLAVHYAAIGQASRLFMPHRAPAMAGIPPDEAEAFGGVVDAVYEFQDLLLGRLLELAGEEAVVIAVSTHGMATGPQRPTGPLPHRADVEAAWHRGGGVCVLAGPMVRRDELIERVSPFDITPTILVLLGLSYGEDMAGRPLSRAMREPLPIAGIPSWEAEIPLAPAAADATAAAWEAADALVALGYTDAVADQTPLAAEAYVLQLFHRAQSLMDAGRFRRAAMLFQQLAVYRPACRQFQIDAFRSTFASGDTAAARRQLRAALAGGHGGPLVQLGLATLDLADRQPLSALAHLDRIDPSTCDTADVLVLKGEALRALGRCEAARQAYQDALALDATNEKAWLGQAKTLRGLGELDAARHAITQAIAHQPDAAPAHMEMAMIQYRLGDPAAARRALLRALSLDPASNAARRLLSRLQFTTPA